MTLYLDAWWQGKLLWEKPAFSVGGGRGLGIGAHFWCWSNFLLMCILDSRWGCSCFGPGPALAIVDTQRVNLYMEHTSLFPSLLLPVVLPFKEIKISHLKTLKTGFDSLWQKSRSCKDFNNTEFYFFLIYIQSCGVNMASPRIFTYLCISIEIQVHSQPPSACFSTTLSMWLPTHAPGRSAELQTTRAQ